MSFSHFCISVISYPIVTKFAAELPASKGSPQSNFEGNCSSYLQDKSGQSFDFFSSYSSSYFCTLAKIAIKCKHVI